ncbi:MAG TPA: hypothetical protein VFX46_04170 [Hyphomicrobiaceae bacterium]|jgi:hypothetical protein|nr:MAG: hypothetical protein DIU57_21195 [Pseudomonadota bacterium]HEX5599813.1 hypothetical protein [Hyphomicrobiaceae bacterium]
MDYLVLLTGLACALALVGLGGAFYEFTVVDPFWPKRPDLIQPQRGGISRKQFWIPAHISFEIVLIVTLIVAWSAPDVRFWLIVAVISHATMRIWSAFDFIPKALAFETADPQSVTETEARNWTRRSIMRLPLALLTSFATLAAFFETARLS